MTRTFVPAHRLAAILGIAARAGMAMLTVLLVARLTMAF